jgi:hypothetical protein
MYKKEIGPIMGKLLQIVNDMHSSTKQQSAKPWKIGHLHGNDVGFGFDTTLEQEGKISIWFGVRIAFWEKYGSPLSIAVTETSPKEVLDQFRNRHADAVNFEGYVVCGFEPKAELDDDFSAKVRTTLQEEFCHIFGGFAIRAPNIWDDPQLDDPKIIPHSLNSNPFRDYRWKPVFQKYPGWWMYEVLYEANKSKPKQFFTVEKVIKLVKAKYPKKFTSQINFDKDVVDLNIAFMEKKRAIDVDDEGRIRISL